MSVLVRFEITDQRDVGGASFEDVASRLAQRGRGSGMESPSFLVWANPTYPDSTVVECLGVERFVSALHMVNEAIDALGLRNNCNGGDLRLPDEPVK